MKNLLSSVLVAMVMVCLWVGCAGSEKLPDPATPEGMRCAFEEGEFFLMKVTLPPEGAAVAEWSATERVFRKATLESGEYIPSALPALLRVTPWGGKPVLVWVIPTPARLPAPADPASASAATPAVTATAPTHSAAPRSDPQPAAAVNGTSPGTPDPTPAQAATAVDPAPSATLTTPDPAPQPTPNSSGQASPNAGNGD